MKIKESIVVPHNEWIDEGRASPNDLLSFTIAVKQTNIDKLEKVLMEVSDPSSPVYGQHLTKEEIDEMIAPSPSSLFAIIDWLKSNQIPLSNVKTTGNSDFIQIPLTVAQFEKLLHTKVHVFSHRQKKNQRIKRVKKDYSLPEHLHAHIDFVAPTVRFPKTFGPVAYPKYKSRPLLRATPNDVCSAGVSPACLRAIYQIPANQTAKSTTAVACMGFLEQYVSFSDLSSFYSQYQTSLSGYQPTIIGPNVQTSPGTEAMLDIEYLSSVANGASTTFWYVAGRQPNSTAENEPFLDWLTALASTSNPPLVFSTSYGDNENTVNQDYAYRVNIEFIKGGARGISFLFSSGDGGVAGGQSSSCTTFIPTFPAGSPYVTAVGGTTSYPEQAASFSSGGFANYFGQAPYQKQAVNDYLNKYGTNLPSSSLYNATGRGFPDVSAQSTYFPVVCGGFTQPVQGTSCSAPAFSGIVGLLNDIRFSMGKSSLGFLNPLFYEHPEVFNDITQGSNPGCNTNGFYAAQGWDPITGLGTPNFPKLVALVESLP